MMTNSNTKRSSLLKLLVLIPIVGIALALNAETVTDYVYNEPQKQMPVKKGRKNATIKTGSGKDIQIVEERGERKEEGDATYDVEMFTVKGKVFDADDKSPIVGAVVKIAGSTKGTVTDREGNFRLELSDGDRSIEVLYVGYDAYSVGVSKAYAKDYDYMIALNKEGADTGKAFDVVENMPKFPGGPQALFEYLAKNVRYPKEAEAAGLQGRVIVTFVVEKDGSVTNANIVKSVDPALDAEALRVVAGMPTWEPGTQNGKAVRVKYTVPITFRLQGEDGKKETGKREGTSLLNEMVVVGFGKQTPADNQPLYIVDGVTMEPEKIKTIDPKSIDHMEVLKNKSSVEKYGEKGKNGVVLITTKK